MYRLKNNYDEGKGIWFISNMDDGQVFDTFKDPDVDTINMMYKRADALDNNFVVTRLSEDAIEKLYYRYVMNAKNKKYECFN